MAMFYCLECDKYIDDDYHPAEPHPKDSLEFICPDCLSDMQALMEEEINGEDYRDLRRPFKPDWRHEVQ
jgi:Zn finger protein HypA/HybF involved in hydrogenase expression